MYIHPKASFTVCLSGIDIPAEIKRELDNWEVFVDVNTGFDGERWFSVSFASIESENIDHGQIAADISIWEGHFSWSVESPRDGASDIHTKHSGRASTFESAWRAMQHEVERLRAISPALTDEEQELRDVVRRAFVIACRERDIRETDHPSLREHRIELFREDFGQEPDLSETAA